ncbi:hypothetical protein [Bacillus pseudomycoides]|uniref:hypothetical protein n=1 Tax=Bacillus pseudomycoides TaxID=64104 RepID=UPI00339246E7
MGSYLQIGLLTVANIPKQVNNHQVNVEDIQQHFFKAYMLNPLLYTITENEDMYCIKLNMNVLQTNVQKFLQKQFSFMELNKYIQEDWETLKIALSSPITSEEILALANEKRFVCFQFGDIYSPVWIKQNILRVQMKILCYHIEGKILAEEFIGTAHYLMRLIRMSDTVNPLVDTVIVTIQ